MSFDKLQHGAESSSRCTATEQLGFGSFCLQLVCNLIGHSREHGWETQNLLCLFSICAHRLPVLFVVCLLFSSNSLCLIEET